MKIHKSENIVMCDIDDTLILHLPEDQLNNYNKVQVYDAVESKHITVGRHEPMIRLLKEELHRGSKVFVWSRGGYQWAYNVMKALDFDSFECKQEIEILSKPMVYFDDKDIASWLPYRVYLNPDITYKTNGLKLAKKGE